LLVWRAGGTNQRCVASQAFQPSALFPVKLSMSLLHISLFRRFRPNASVWRAVQIDEMPRQTTIANKFTTRDSEITKRFSDGISAAVHKI
jgi:hypothetical protein